MPPKKPRAAEKPSERKLRDILRALEELVDGLGGTIKRPRKRRGATQTRHKKKFLN